MALCDAATESGTDEQIINEIIRRENKVFDIVGTDITLGFLNHSIDVEERSVSDYTSQSMTGLVQQTSTQIVRKSGGIIFDQIAMRLVSVIGGPRAESYALNAVTVTSPKDKDIISFSGGSSAPAIAGVYEIMKSEPQTVWKGAPIIVNVTAKSFKSDHPLASFS